MVRLPHRPADGDQCTILGPQLHHHRIAQAAVRDAVAQDDPSILGPSFAAPCVRDVHDLVTAILGGRLRQQRESARSGVIIEDAAAGPRGIVAPCESEEEYRADRRPHDVENEKALRPAACHLQSIICAP